MEERFEKVKLFLAREDLEGTDLNLKKQCLELDKLGLEAREELKEIQSRLEEAQREAQQKQLDMLSLSQRLEGLCGLILSLDDEDEQE